eukprot:11061126-Heterocapsa_arctica.AAC.1
MLRAWRGAYLNTRHRGYYTTVKGAEVSRLLSFDAFINCVRATRSALGPSWAMCTPRSCGCI